MPEPVAMSTEECRVCSVKYTSYQAAQQHLLGRGHLLKTSRAAGAPLGDRLRCVLVTDVSALKNVKIQKIFNSFLKCGKVVDFRCWPSPNKTPMPQTAIHVEFESREAASKALSGGVTVAGHSMRLSRPGGGDHPAPDAGPAAPKKQSPSKKQPPPKEPPPKKQSPPKKQPPPKEKSAQGGAKVPPEPADPIQHDVLLDTLRHLASSRTEDELLSWLCGQLLLTPAEHDSRVRLCLDLQAALRVRFRTCLVQVFGSSVSGLGFHGCDLDVYAFIDAAAPDSGLPPDCNDARKVRVVARLLEGLRQPELCSHVLRIPHARVPIIKFRSPRLGGIQCDMSFKDPMSCQNSRLVAWLMDADKRAHVVTVAVRYWARRRQLAGGVPSPLKMSSYCLTLLVITYLQQLKPPVLPSVAWLQADVPEVPIGPWNAAFAVDAAWRPASGGAPADLLRGFFRFGAALQSRGPVVCPLAGRLVPRRELVAAGAGRPAELRRYWDLVAGGQVKRLGAAEPLVVQDPIELNFNVARNYREEGLEHFRDCCALALDMPLAELFEEEPLTKLRRKKAKKAAKAEEVSEAGKASKAASPSPKAAQKVSPAAADLAAAAAVVASRKRERRSSGSSGGDQTAAKVSRPAADGGGPPRTAAADAERGAGGGEKAPVAADGETKPAAGGGAEAMSRSVDSGVEVASGSSNGDEAAVSSPNGGPASGDDAQPMPGAADGGPEAAPQPAAGSPVPDALSLRAHDDLLQRVLADFDQPPSRVAVVPLQAGRRPPRSAAEARCCAAAFARLLHAVFARVLLFECVPLSFAELDVSRDVVQGFACMARLPTWEFRRVAAAQLVGREKNLEFETDVSRRALKMVGGKADGVLASFSCYLVLGDMSINVCFYAGSTLSAGRNCHNFVPSYVQELGRRIDYCRLFGS